MGFLVINQTKENMNPTQEQSNIVVAAEDRNIKVVVVNACAGSGKTSTCILTANAVVRRSVYLCFNKATAMEAETRFPNHVDCRTSHSMAWPAFGSAIQHKLSRPKGKYVNVAGTGSEVARFYRLRGVEDACTANAIGLYVKQTVERFEQSASLVMDRTHVPQHEMVKVIEADPTVIGYVLRASQQMWADRINPSNPVLATHDTYLKQYQMSKPILNYDVVYLDEAQDTTPCVLDIIMNQMGHAELVLVGDRRQAIYQWRGATNAMSALPGTVCNLSQSFRYGQGIAEVASACLHYDMKITGRADIQTTIGYNVVDRTKPYMYLFRTNSMLLIEAVDAIDRGEKVRIEIDVRDFVKILESAEALFKDDLKNVKHERILPYPTWAEMVEESKDSGELKRLVGIIESGRAAHIINVLANYIEPSDFIATLTTGHKAKGRECEQVILADDFPTNYKKGQWVGLPEAEENLLYVALTRAIRVLEPNTSLFEIMDKYKIPYIDTRFDDWNTGTIKVDADINNLEEFVAGASPEAIARVEAWTGKPLTGATTVHIAKARPAGGVAQFHMDDYSKAVERFIGGHGGGDMAQFANEGIEQEQAWIQARRDEGYSMQEIEHLPF